MHPRSAVRALCPELRAHLGPRKLLGWRGTCKGKREARRDAVRARLRALGIRTCWQGDEMVGAGLVAVLPESRIKEAAPDTASAGPRVPGPGQSSPLHPGRPAGGKEGLRGRPAPCTRRTSLPSRPAATGPLCPLPKRCPTSKNFVGETDCIVNFPLGGIAFPGGVGGDGAKRTSEVLPPSPSPGQVSRRRNGDTARTVRGGCCSTGSPFTGKLPSRARRAGQGAGPLPSSWERQDNLPGAPSLGAHPPPRAAAFIWGPETQRQRACAHRTSRNARVPIRDARSECIAALRAPAWRAGAARGIIRESPPSRR